MTTATTLLPIRPFYPLIAHPSYQSAAAMALEFSKMQPQSVARSSSFKAASQHQQQGSSTAGGASNASADSELEQRRRARTQRAAQLEAQHRALQQRLVAGGGAFSQSFTPPSLVPQVPPSQPHSSVRRSSEVCTA